MPSCSSCSRWGNGMRRPNLITPHSTSRPMPGTPFPPPVSITPYPVTAVPGSTPRTLTSPGHRGHRLGVDVEVREHLGDVVHLLESLDEVQQRLGVAPFDLHGVLRDHGDLGALHGELLGPQRFVHGVKLVRRRGDHEDVALAVHVLGAGVERRFHGHVFVGFPVHYDLPLAVEHPRDRIGGAEVAAVAREHVADFGDGAVGVVGGRLDQDRRAARAIPLVHHFLVRDPLELAGPLLDGALDVVPRHVLGFGGVDGGAEAGVAGRVAAPLLRGDRDLADDFGEGGAALLIGDGLLPLDLLPFAMARHGNNLQLDRATAPQVAFPPMSRAAPLLLVLPLLVAGCERRADGGQERTFAARALRGVLAFPQSSLISVAAGEEAAEVVLTTPVAMPDVAQWYRTNLPANGWELKTDQVDRAGAVTMYAEKGKRPLWLTLRANAGGAGTTYTLVGAVVAGDT